MPKDDRDFIDALDVSEELNSDCADCGAEDCAWREEYDEHLCDDCANERAGLEAEFQYK